MSSRPVSPALLALAVTVHLLLTTLVWKDIGRRADAELRGGKRLWRVLTALNTGNHLVYLAVGRRRR